MRQRCVRLCVNKITDTTVYCRHMSQLHPLPTNWKSGSTLESRRGLQTQVTRTVRQERTRMCMMNAGTYKAAGAQGRVQAAALPLGGSVKSAPSTIAAHPVLHVHSFATATDGASLTDQKRSRHFRRGVRKPLRQGPSSSRYPATNVCTLLSWHAAARAT